MGNRANYVVIENGQAQIFFSRWDALTTPAVMLSGPALTLTYIRGLDEENELMNNTWAEGGILMNLDTHHALFWGGSRIAVTPYLRRPLLRLLARLWPEWSVEWAASGIADLARASNWDVTRVLDNDFSDPTFLAGTEPIITDAKLLACLSTDDAVSILTVRRKTGVLSDYLINLQQTWIEPRRYHLAAIYQVLSYGPQLLSLLPDESKGELPGEDYQELSTGAYLDEETQTIWLWNRDELNPHEIEAVARRWPGWQIQGHVDGLYRQMQLSGRDPAPVQVPEEQAIQKLVEELVRTQAVDPLKIAQTMQQALPPEELQGTRFGKGFFTNAQIPLTSQERGALLERLLLLSSDNESMRKNIDKER